MTRERGHIDERAERGRRMSKALESVRHLSEFEDGLERVFNNTYGRRTYDLIRHAGIVRRGTGESGLTDVITSAPITFRVPNQADEYGLSFEMESMRPLIRVPGVRPRHTCAVSAELSILGDNPEMRDDITLRDNEFVSGTPIKSEDNGYERGAIRAHSQKIAVFGTILSFAEAVVAGRNPTELPDYTVPSPDALALDEGNIIYQP